MEHVTTYFNHFATSAINFITPSGDVMKCESLLSYFRSEPFLQLNPEDAIKFHDRSKSSTATLKLNNLRDGRVAYKMKTTAPKVYSVQPCLGVLLQGASVDINLSLTNECTDADLKRHRFLVQAIPLPETTQEEWSPFSNRITQEEWSSFSNTLVKRIQEWKLNVSTDDAMLTINKNAGSTTIGKARTSVVEKLQDKDFLVLFCITVFITVIAVVCWFVKHSPERTASEL